jgi:acetyltransferase-like isoleucine patch superfamily enzyme
VPTGIRLPWDWFDGALPGNVELGEAAFVETSYSFHACRSRREPAVRLGRAAQVYLAVMFDVGAAGQVVLGDFSSITGGCFVCDAQITLGTHCLLSWNVVIMDSYRLPLEPGARRAALERVAATPHRTLEHCGAPPRPVRIDDKVWIGFDCCVLPGVHIGEGSVVAAKSVVAEDVPPYCLVAGNPAQVIRRLAPHGSRA